MKNYKGFYYIWIVLLGLLLYLVTMSDVDTSVIVVLVVLLVGGAVMLQNLKKTLTEIIIEADAVHLHFLNKDSRSIIPRGIMEIRRSKNQMEMILTDKSEYIIKPGKTQVVISGESTTEIRPEDFPYARFVDKAKK